MGTSTTGIAHAAITATISMPMGYGIGFGVWPRGTNRATQLEERAEVSRSRTSSRRAISCCGGECPAKRAPRCWCGFDLHLPRDEESLDHMKEVNVTNYVAFPNLDALVEVAL